MLGLSSLLSVVCRISSEYRIRVFPMRDRHASTIWQSTARKKVKLSTEATKAKLDAIIKLIHGSISRCHPPLGLVLSAFA